MPVYEYKCTRCGAVFEKLVRLFEEEKPHCPACDCEDAEKLISKASQIGDEPGFSPGLDYTCGATKSYG